MFYTARIVINLMNQERNIFHQRYLKNQPLELLDHMVAGIDHSDLEHRAMIEQIEQDRLSAIDNLDISMGSWYYKALANAIKEHGSMREVSRKTGIPISSISNAVKKIREHLT